MNQSTPAAQRYEQALGLHRSGRLDEADSLYREVLAEEPMHFGALHLLGVIEGQRCRYAQAAELITRALEVDPDSAAAHVNLGNVQHALGSFAAAAASYQRALVLQPGHRFALMGLGKARWSMGLLGQALASYDAALEIEPDCAESLMSRGDILLAMGRQVEGVAALRRAVERGADAESVRYALASSGAEAAPERAPDSYVKSLFDRYAERFDDELVGTLQYRTPELLAGLVRRHLGDGGPRPEVLELGCGTGLCGVLLRPFAARLTGIDLSEQMLEKARARGVYDRLECAEITAWLAGCEPCGLVVAADVLTYFGDLGPVLGAVRRVLHPGGRFGFSIEANPGEGYELAPTRRYRHARAHVERLAGEHGFELEAVEDCALRVNDGADVAGHLVLLRVPERP